MINQFTESVRRNQKQWMVVITILAVFSFVFDDLIRNAGTMSSGNIIFIAVFCAAGMSIIGYRRGKTTEFGLAGLLIGALVAFIGMRSAGPPVVVRTNVGNFTRSDLNLLRSRRQRVDQFLMTASKKIDKGQPAPRFGAADDGSMVMFALLQKEARRMGVSLSDASVNQFLSRVTQDKLTASIYNETLREVSMTEGELFNILRSELEVQLVGQLISAPADSHPTMAQFTRGMYSGRIARQTPEQLWQSFRKLHVRQALTSIAVPVSEFVKLVPEPNESELARFFDKFKSRYGDNQGTPGFLEPPKVRLAYLAVSDLEAYEKQVPEITDQDVVDYYVTNKESYRVLDLPEPSGPMLDPTSDTSRPADASQPENTENEKVPALPVDAAPELKDGKDKPAAPEKPATPDTTPAKDGASKGETPCDDKSSNDKSSNDKSDNDKTDNDKTEVPSESAAKADAETAKPEESPAKSEDKSPPAPALPSDETPADATIPHSATGSTVPQLNSLPQPAPAPRYRELDEDLKEQIRETILRNKAFVKMGEDADLAMEMMMELSLKISARDPKERDTMAGTFAEDLKEYAKQHSLNYKETELMTRFELMTKLDEPIGAATDPLTGANFNRTPVSVADEVFEAESSGRGFRLPTFSPRRADTRDARYAYWKILEVPAKVPDLKDTAVRKKVLDAYKFEMARPLAEKRTRELVDLMTEGKADIAAALSGQTINGTTDSPAVTIRETPKFTWLRLPQSLPQFGLQRPVESTIEGIGQPGFAFMKTVFDELGNGDVGVTINSSRTSYFAVRVRDRDGAGDESEGVATLPALQAQFAREQLSGFLPTPYEFIGAEIQQIIDSRWQADFRKRFGIEFERDAAGEAEEE